MTRNELNRLRNIKGEITKNERKLKVMREKINRLTQELSDMPKSPNASDNMGEIIAQMVDLERLIALEQEKAIIEEKRMMAFISKIPDSRTRQIFDLRFLECLSWVEVAKLVSPYETADSARMVVKRFLKSRSFCSERS